MKTRIPLNAIGRIAGAACLITALAACSDRKDSLTGVSSSPVSPTDVSANEDLSGGVSPTTTTTTMASPAAPSILTVTYPTVTGRQWLVRAGDNLQNALNNAKRGDEIVLQAGAKFTGNFTLPAKSGTIANGWIIVRSEKLSLLSPGTRVVPAQASLMAKIVTPGVAPAIRTATSGSTSGWYLAGLELTIDPAVTKQQYGVIWLGDGSGAQSSLSAVATDLVLDRLYIHAQTTTYTSRCVQLNSARSAIINSYLSECHAKGYDSQAIAGWNGPGPFKIANNTLIGAGENIMFGGADPAITGLIPSDIEIRGNFIYTPAAWKGVWTKKNLLELKNAQRVLIAGNVFDGSWLDGQNGTGIALKSSNQSGRCTWCATRDITFRNNLVRNVGQPFNFVGRANGNPIGELLGRILIENTIIDKVNVAPYYGDPRFILLLPGVHDVTIRHTTMTSSAAITTFTTIANGVSNVIIDANIFIRGKYGLMADGGYIGTAAMNRIAGTRVFTNNSIIGSSNGIYPSTTAWVSSLSGAVLTSVGASTTLLSNLASVQIY